MFVNPKSGSRKGQKFIDLGSAKLSFEIRPADNVDIKNQKNDNFKHSIDGRDVIAVVMRIVDMTNAE